MLALKNAQPLGDVVQMHVHADLRALLVIRLEEGALGDHDLGLADVLADQVRARGRVAGEGNQRDLKRARDLNAAILELLELLLRHVHKLGLELRALFAGDVAEGWTRVLGLKAAQQDVVLDLEGLVGQKRDQLVGRALTLKIDVPLHHALDGWRDARVAHDLGGAHALEAALRAVVREATDVIHVAVRDREMLGGEHRARARADVEPEIKLGDDHRRRLTRDRLAVEAERREIQEALAGLTGRRLGDHLESSGSGLSPALGPFGRSERGSGSQTIRIDPTQHSSQHTSEPTQTDGDGDGRLQSRVRLSLTSGLPS